MEQIKELLNILSETPEMALWGLGIYFTFYLMKMASWITALAYILKLFINRYFDAREKALNQSKAKEVLDYFESHSLGSAEKQSLCRLIDEMRAGTYVHGSDIESAIKAIRESKKK